MTQLAHMTESENWMKYESLGPAAFAEALGHLAGVSTHQRRRMLAALVEREYQLDEERLRAFTHLRLSAFLGLAASDLEAAKKVGRSYDEVFAELPAEVAMRRALHVQSVVISDLAADEVRTLLEVIPGLSRQIPSDRLRDYSTGFFAQPQGGPEEVDSGTYRTVLVPLDGSPIAEQALGHLRRAVTDRGAAEVTLLRVVQIVPLVAEVGAPVIPLATEENEVAIATAYLEGVRQVLQEDGFTNIEISVRTGQVPNAIVEAAESCDLVVIATHGRSGLARTVRGSVADYVVRNTPNSAVLVIRPRE